MKPNFFYLKSFTMKQRIPFRFCLWLLALLAPFAGTAQNPCDNNSSSWGMSLGGFPEENSFSIVDDNQDVVYAWSYSTFQNLQGELCLLNGCYIIQMYDSFGDGWNGAILDINVNGTVLSYTLPSGTQGSYLLGVNSEGCVGGDVAGCTDPNAANYSAEATLNDYSCIYAGCTDPSALNYSYSASIDDGSCAYCEGENAVMASLYICTFSNPQDVGLIISDDQGNVVFQTSDISLGGIYTGNICLQSGTCYTATLFNSSDQTGWYGGYFTVSVNGLQYINSTLPQGISTLTVDFSIDGTCGTTYTSGCTDPQAINYNPEATYDDGSCIYPIYGCTDPAALNYYEFANADDGSCFYEVNCDNATQVSMSFINAGIFPTEISFAIINSNNETVFYWANSNGTIGAIGTACLADGCYTLSMYDSFGDGWNDGIVELIINDQSYTFTLPAGAVGNVAFGVNTEGCVGGDIYGCTDPAATNFNAEATISDNTCLYAGCTDPTAINYNWSAGVDDGSCEYCDGENSVMASLYICTFSNGEQVVLTIADDQGNVVFESPVLPFVGSYYGNLCLQQGVCYTATMSNNTGAFGWYGGYFTVSTNGVTYINASLLGGSDSMDVQFSIDGTCGPVLGCTDPNAMNYNEAAQMNDGSCVYPTYGCTDPDALNYFQGANVDDGSCVYVQECGEGTTAVIAQYEGGTWAYEGSYSITDEFGVVLMSGTGGTSATFACLPNGCYTVNMYDTFGDGWQGGGYLIVQFNGTATTFTFDNGTFSTGSFGINSEGCVVEVAGCTDPSATNYNVLATIDDGSCYYPENCDYNAISVIVCTQNFGSEMSWNLVDSDGNVVASSAGYTSWYCYTESLCLADGCYTLNMSDSWGDGWNGGYVMIQGAGAYFEGSLLYGSAESVMISINSNCSDVYGCMDADAMNYNPYATMDDGSCIMNNNGNFNANGFLDLQVELEMYPNPVEDGMVVNLNNLDKSSAVTLDVISIDGKLISSQTVQNAEKSKNIQMDMSNYAPGYYFLKVKSGALFIAKPFVKQ
jgi:Secretion system C-terminal sorting domain